MQNWFGACLESLAVNFLPVDEAGTSFMAADPPGMNTNL